MRELVLPDGVRTSQLGFGCSSLLGARTRAESVRALEEAFAAGVRHFDVAPMYGYGQAESCLGELVARHPGQVTITTKYGIPPAGRQGLLSLGRRLARPVVKLLPGMKQRLTRAAGAVSGAAAKSSFTAEQATASLENSLRELRTDHIHLWLLHEVEAGDLEGEGLLRMMEEAVRAGKVGAFGVASGREKLDALLEHAAAVCGVAQFEWSVLDPVIGETGYLRVHHRAISEPYQRLREALAREAGVTAEWSAMLGVDLAAAAERNPKSVVLFSSKSAGHMEETVRVVGDRMMAERAVRLHELVQRDLGRLEL